MGYAFQLVGGLDYSYPLSHTFNTVELVGEPVALGHLANNDAMVRHGDSGEDK